MFFQDDLLIESTPRGFWIHRKQPPGDPPHTPLPQLLTWVLDQVLLGHFSFSDQGSQKGEFTSLTLGRSTARRWKSEAEAERVAEEARNRMMLAYALAQALESGVPQKHENLSKELLDMARDADGARFNLELHYAYELVGVLVRLSRKSLKLDVPTVPWEPETVGTYLSEATRCYTHGLYTAAVILCRSCLEEALRRAPGQAGKEPDLKAMINRAHLDGLLDDCQSQMAHSVRDAGNRCAHGETADEEHVRKTLDDTRSLVASICGSVSQ